MEPANDIKMMVSKSPIEKSLPVGPISGFFLVFRIVDPSAPVQLRPRCRSPSNSASPSRWKCLAGPAPSVDAGGTVPGCPGQLEDVEASKS